MAKFDITDTLIRQLITMPKQVINPNARRKMEGRQTRQDYRLVSRDNDQEFALFLRQSTRLETSYTAGLRWLRPGDESLMLMRCNGSSHEHRNVLEGDTIRFECHVHIATERYLSIGRREEGYAIAVRAYNNLGGALRELVARCSIVGLPLLRESANESQMSLL